MEHPMTLLQDRVRVVAIEDLPYVKRDWCGRHFADPYLDEPGWTTIDLSPGRHPT
jgi:hypothetical protein